MPPTFQHILVATDFGDAALHARDVAVAIAGKFDAKITLLHACVLPPLPYGSVFALPLDAIVDMAKSDLEAELAETRRAYPNVAAVVRMGSPGEVIVAAASELGADLIVLGTHGRGLVARTLLGSVAENVLRLAPVPVLTVSMHE
jgi:nucleotide-binding universal stress UspA family protein